MKSLAQKISRFWKTLTRGVDYEPPSGAQLAAHQALMDKRLRQAVWIGSAAFAVNIIEPWFDFPDLGPVKIQFVFVLITLSFAAVSYTTWGSRHRLNIFTCGYLMVVVGFETNVIYEKAFDTEYSAGFPELFAFYCVMIPASLSRTALTGVAVLAIMIVGEAAGTGHFQPILRMIIENNTAFLILLYGRYVANNLWEAEFRAKEGELAAKERELVAKEGELAAINSQTDFTAAVAHDFRTGLVPLCSLSEQLAAGQITDEQDRVEAYQVLVEESRGIEQLITRLLDFAAARSNSNYDLQTLNPADFIKKVIAEHQIDIDLRRHTLDLELGANIRFVSADPVALQSVIWNLVDNAMKYSPDHTPILLTVYNEAAHVAIRVIDQGMGIPDTEQLHIFDQCFRGEDAKRNAVRGSGLGLANVSHIVHKHGGEVRVESKTHQGSTFTVRLPFCE